MVQVQQGLGAWKVVQVQQGLDARYLTLILICTTLSCSLQAPMEKFLNLKPNVSLPPPVDTQALVAAILFSPYEDQFG